MAQTNAALLAEIERLRGTNERLSKDNAILRSDNENTIIDDLNETIDSLRRQLKEEKDECAAYKQETEEQAARIELLEAASDPDTITAYVHDFLRAEHAIVGSLDFPMILTPSFYRDGLSEAVQKAVP